MAKNEKEKGKYINSITEDQKDSRKNGDVEVIVAGERRRSAIKKKLIKKLK